MKKMIEIVIAIAIFCGGFFTGFFIAPKEVKQITEIENHYAIENKQQTETKVFSGQVQLLISGSNAFTNINVNLKEVTNISISFSTNSNLVLSITNKEKK